MPDTTPSRDERFPWDLPSSIPVDDGASYLSSEARKTSAWTRKRVAAVSGIAGLLVGIGAATSASLSIESSSERYSAADVDAAVASAVRKAHDDFGVERERFEAQSGEEVARLEGELRTAKAELRNAKRQAKVRQDRAVAHAVALARRRADARVAAAKAAASKPRAFVSSGGGRAGTDPRFNYCYEATDAGYGPYYRGTDPEYDWYDDADGDGVVCE